MLEELYTDSEPVNSYSIDFLTKTIFEYELRNKLLIQKEVGDNENEIIISYFEKRIKEITKVYS